MIGISQTTSCGSTNPDDQIWKKQLHRSNILRRHVSGHICLLLERLPVKEDLYRRDPISPRLLRSSYDSFPYFPLEMRRRTFDVEVLIIVFQISSLCAFQLYSLHMTLDASKKGPTPASG